MSVSKFESLAPELMSSAQVYRAISQIEDLLQKGNINAAAKSRGLKSPYKKDSEIDGPLSIFFSKTPKVAELQALKTKLENIAESAPVVRLTLSDMPEPNFQVVLTKWFRNLHPFCLIELTVDDSIVGGVIIKTGHKRYDHSIRTLIAEQKAHLGEIVAHA